MLPTPPVLALLFLVQDLLASAFVHLYHLLSTGRTTVRKDGQILRSVLAVLAAVSDLRPVLHHKFQGSD